MDDLSAIAEKLTLLEENKKVSEEYLVDAESFTETEKRATKAATELIGTRDFDITAISR